MKHLRGTGDRKKKSDLYHASIIGDLIPEFLLFSANPFKE